MELQIDDAAFVRAPASLVYRRLTDVAGWPTWWRGVRVRPLPSSDGEETWALELAGAGLRRLRIAARLGGWRLDTGFVMTLWGDIDGEAEFWLERAHHGTLVHHVLTGRTARVRPRSVLGDYRRALRRGTWGLKDLLQSEARAMAGLDP